MFKIQNIIVIIVLASTWFNILRSSFRWLPEPRPRLPKRSVSSLGAPLRSAPRKADLVGWIVEYWKLDKWFVSKDEGCLNSLRQDLHREQNEDTLSLWESNLETRWSTQQPHVQNRHRNHHLANSAIFRGSKYKHGMLLWRCKIQVRSSQQPCHVCASNLGKRLYICLLSACHSAQGCSVDEEITIVDCNHLLVRNYPEWIYSNNKVQRLKQSEVLWVW